MPVTAPGGRWLSLVSVALFFIAWELVCRSGWINPVLLSAPSGIVAAGAELMSHRMLWLDLAYTALAFAMALGSAILGGAAVGGLIGYSRTAYFVVNPFVVAINGLPKVVLMPLVVLWVGIGSAASVFLGALMASFPILTATFSGIRALDPDHVRLARSFGAGSRVIVRTIVIPGVAPYLLSGVRVGLNYAMVGVLIAEFFGASQGVGYRMMLLMANFEVASFFAYLLIVASFTLGATTLVHAVERRATRWRPDALRAPGGL